MVRKNVTITREENAFLGRHPEINQSALFRHVVKTLMTMEARGATGRGRDVLRPGIALGPLEAGPSVRKRRRAAS
jgi:hypothetical protein